jgi:hypothetical protein
VEISEEARRRAEARVVEQHLWGEIRYDPPHTDDPDLPFEAEHHEWIELMKKVFGDSLEGRPERPAAESADGASAVTR